MYRKSERSLALLQTRETDMKTKLFKTKEEKLTYLAAVQLQELAADLAKRSLTVNTEDGPVTIALPKNVKVETAGKCKQKEQGSKCKIEIEISWEESAPCSCCEQE